MLTSEDTELKGLLELDEAALTDLLASDYACARNFQRDEEARALSYLADMREVLRLESGAGVRVLRHWLDAACVNERLSRTNASIYGATALYDFARDRMADIALSDPVSHVRIQLEGARQWSRTGMQQEKRAGGSTGTGAARAAYARPAGPEADQGRS